MMSLVTKGEEDKNKLKGGNIMKDKKTCAVCGEEHGLDDIHKIEIKGKDKNVCKGCVAAIKGFS